MCHIRQREEDISGEFLITQNLLRTWVNSPPDFQFVCYPVKSTNTDLDSSWGCTKKLLEKGNSVIMPENFSAGR